MSLPRAAFALPLANSANAQLDAAQFDSASIAQYLAATIARLCWGCCDPADASPSSCRPRYKRHHRRGPRGESLRRVRHPITAWIPALFPPRQPAATAASLESALRDFSYPG
mmetsp:Transcript_25504/g.70373  ORF Transcript_25504/g.70373 Transcript_25504/m.70373 type:complete len:112 (-) Transcript_25504:573-908(-)